MSVPMIDLPGGGRIPQLGVGVFQVPPAETAANVAAALKLGYRHVDTAAAYRNEAEVGDGIRDAGFDPGEVFITTKCWNDDQGYEESRAACQKSLARLGVDQVDLYLIHWPAPALGRYRDTWRAFVELQREGAARDIGVSNFQPAHLEQIVDDTGVTPAVNQIELHPYLQQPELRRVHAERGIVTEAWSPLAQGDVLGDAVIGELAERHAKTPAQVVIRWHLQLGNVVFPKSISPERLRENLAVLDFELSGEDMEAIAGLDRGERVGPDPDTFTRP